MMNFLFFHAADTNVTARFRKIDVSQQSLMELFVADLTDVGISKTEEGDFIDIAEWSILKFDSEQNIVSIIMDSFEGVDMNFFDCDEDRSIISECFLSNGRINFAYVPLTTRHLDITWLDYKGTIDTADLPDALIHLELRSNAFHGSFRIESLPKDIERVLIADNRFSGSFHMESLPPRIIEFDVSDNEFSGTVNLNALPKDITTLNLRKNTLEGALSLLNLPKKLHKVFLSGNRFDTHQLVMDDSRLFTIFAVDKEFEGKIERPDGAPCTPSGLQLLSESDSDLLSDEMYHFDFDNED